MESKNDAGGDRRVVRAAGLGRLFEKWSSDRLLDVPHDI